MNYWWSSRSRRGWLQAKKRLRPTKICWNLSRGVFYRLLVEEHLTTSAKIANEMIFIWGCFLIWSNNWYVIEYVWTCDLSVNIQFDLTLAVWFKCRSASKNRKNSIGFGTVTMESIKKHMNCVCTTICSTNIQLNRYAFQDVDQHRKNAHSYENCTVCGIKITIRRNRQCKLCDDLRVRGSSNLQWPSAISLRPINRIRWWSPWNISTEISQSKTRLLIEKLRTLLKIYPFSWLSTKSLTRWSELSISRRDIQKQAMDSTSKTSALSHGFFISTPKKISLRKVWTQLITLACWLTL